jgi:hypothetical protein
MLGIVQDQQPRQICQRLAQRGEAIDAIRQLQPQRARCSRGRERSLSPWPATPTRWRRPGRHLAGQNLLRKTRLAHTGDADDGDQRRAAERLQNLAYVLFAADERAEPVRPGAYRGRRGRRLPGAFLA